MSFLASVYPRALDNLASITGGDDMTRSELSHPVEASRAILENQTVRTEQIFRNGNCIGVTAYHLASGVDASTSGYYGTTANTALGCGILTGSEAQTIPTSYDNNIFYSTPWVIREERCNNAVMAAEELSYQLAWSMNQNRMRLNQLIINTLAANIQPNQWAATPTALGAGTANRVTLATSAFNKEGLRLIELLAKSNQIDQPIILDGTNFYVDADIAMFKALNDNDRADRAVYNTSNLYHDYKDLTAVLGRNSTLIVDAGVPIFRSFTNYTNEAPVQVSTSDDRWVFRVPDPVLSVRENGQVVPLYHEVEYKRECVERDGSGKVQYGWNGMTSLRGMFDIAPAGFTKPLETGVAATQTLTGIMEIEAV